MLGLVFANQALSIWLHSPVSSSSSYCIQPRFIDTESYSLLNENDSWLVYLRKNQPICFEKTLIM